MLIIILATIVVLSVFKRNKVFISVPVTSASGVTSTIQYSVLLDGVDEPGFGGYYYAHTPALDLTTQGKGIEGAVAAARDLAELWLAEKQSRAERVPCVDEFRRQRSTER